MTDNRTFYDSHNYADQCCSEAERMEQMNEKEQIEQVEPDESLLLGDETLNKPFEPLGCMECELITEEMSTYDANIQCSSCERKSIAQAQLAKAAAYYQAEIARLTKEAREQEVRIKELEDYNNRILKGETWYWMNDGEDHLEGIICPIIINAETLRELVAQAREQAFREVGVWLSDVCPHTEFTLKRDCYRCREQLKAGKLGG